MHLRLTTCLIVLVCLAVSPIATAQSTATAPATQEPAMTQAVLNANAGFYAALNTLFTGDDGPMADVWSHADDVTYMGPLGASLHGWDQVAQTWAEQAAMKLGGGVQTHDVRVVVSAGLALVTNIEHGRNPHTIDGPMDVLIRATNVYRLEDGAWKMIHHHTDLLPTLVEESKQMQGE
ncbi:MAG: nuclear transport factor 2 family protein [Planctomycetota bacterium]